MMLYGTSCAQAATLNAPFGTTIHTQIRTPPPTHMNTVLIPLMCFASVVLSPKGTSPIEVVVSHHI
eukprot:scaffold89644_cov32-Tisochrysis_lutea.AAC.3